MSRTNNTPLLLGAGALGLLVLAAAASSPSARKAAQQTVDAAGKAAKKLEEKVEVLITDWIPTLLRKTSQHEGAGVEAFLDEQRTRYQPQLNAYAAAFDHSRKGLYFPLLRGWRDW